VKGDGDEKSITLESMKDSPEQIWRIEKLAETGIKIISNGSGMALGVKMSGSTGSFVLEKKNDDPLQIWNTEAAE